MYEEALIGGIPAGHPVLFPRDFRARTCYNGLTCWKDWPLFCRYDMDMTNEMIENIRVLAPFIAFLWALTVFCVLWRPQRYLNSILLMFTLFMTMLFFSCFFPGNSQAYYLLICFLLVMLALLFTPILLIANGIVMIRRESFSAAHVLSLALGIFVGAGEIAAALYVMVLTEMRSPGEADLFLLLIFISVFYFSFLVLSFVVYSVFIQIMPHGRNFDYVIIHGCGLAGGERLTKILQNRVDKAVALYRKCRKKPVIIPSGGCGADEKLSEAQAMKDYLLICGIPEENIVPEDSSATTRENLLNSKAIIDSREGKKKTALVSSNYHIYRCLRLAREIGLKCTGIGAPVALYYWPSALIREFIAVFMTKRFLLWAMLGYLVCISPVIFVFLGR